MLFEVDLEATLGTAISVGTMDSHDTVKAPVFMVYYGHQYEYVILDVEEDIKVLSHCKAFP